MSITTKTAPAAATTREWVGLAVLALPTLLLSIDMSVLYLALPSLAESLRPSSTQQLWIMDAYGFMVAGFLVTMGTLGDRVGRRKLLLIGSAGFAAASVLAAYSTSSEMLIVARALMGVTGATLMPSTLALISNMFQRPQQRAMAIAVWMSCFMGGMVVGPLTAGVMLQHFWWGSVFLLAVPVMVLLFIAAPALLPEYRDPNPGHLDITSVALSLTAILPVVYGLKETARHGFESVPVLVAAFGVAMGVLFIRRQSRLTHPLIDVRLFRIRRFSVSLGINVVSGLVMAGTFLLTTLYLQLVLGLSPLASGAWMVPVQLLMVGASLSAPRVAQRIRPAYIMSGGLLVSAVGFVVIGVATLATGYGDSPLPLVVGFALCAVGHRVPGRVDHRPGRRLGAAGEGRLRRIGVRDRRRDGHRVRYRFDGQPERRRVPLRHRGAERSQLGPAGPGARLHRWSRGRRQAPAVQHLGSADGQRAGRFQLGPGDRISDRRGGLRHHRCSRPGQPARRAGVHRARRGRSRERRGPGGRRGRRERGTWARSRVAPGAPR
ncbi:MFS transporter [Luteipulveratus mongoliensis]|uniref:MFS transporter n=1 Tax=Luteipulveratus mongoliensis TaxID=571913 RepID=UPI000AE581CE|nr:MFS transporter [Luteipulveratus mongoliensis]